MGDWIMVEVNASLRLAGDRCKPGALIDTMGLEVKRSWNLGTWSCLSCVGGTLR